MLAQFSWICLKHMTVYYMICRLQNQRHMDSLNFPLDYLSLRKHRIEVGSSYRKWSKTCRGKSQGSILGPLLFNIFIKGIFFFVEKSEICNFADDKTVYSFGKDLP